MFHGVASVDMITPLQFSWCPDPGAWSRLATSARGKAPDGDLERIDEALATDDPGQRELHCWLSSFAVV
jgi:hypothetical protein